MYYLFIFKDFSYFVYRWTGDLDEPIERDELPWLKDPNVKISIWTVIKDSIGKGDLSKMSVPVYFNDPTSLLQKCA